MKAHDEALSPSGFTHLILLAGALAVAGPLKFTLAEAAVISFAQSAQASSQRRVSLQSRICSPAGLTLHECKILKGRK